MESNTSSTTESRREEQRLDQALESAMRLSWSILDQMPVDQRLTSITSCRNLLSAIEAKTIADQVDAGVPDRKIEDKLHRSAGGGESKQTIKKKTQRGKVTRENPALAKQMAKGKLSGEQLDVIAHASDKTGGEAANDTKLINKIAAAPPEQGKKIADEYITERMSQADVDSAYKRARQRRRVTRYTNVDRGTDVLSIEGAPEDIDQIEMQIDALADKYYKDDGGRDKAHNAHPRTRDQRRFDAAQALINGNNPDDETPDGEAESGSKQSAKKRRPTRTAPQTTIVIMATLEQAMGTDPTPIAFADGKPLPRAVLERLSCGAGFVGQIFGADGEPMWQGRLVRYATRAQRLALIVRDGGCVRCQKSADKCVAHHLLPWDSPLEGETNVKDMALVCDDCHHHIHDNHLTLYKDSENIWRLRKAHPNEIPRHSRPPDRNSGRQRRPTPDKPNRSSDRRVREEH